MNKSLLLSLGSLFVAARLFATDQVVSDAGDNGGPNQLRAKLAALQSSGGGTLTFQIGTATILLDPNQGQLSITSACTIDGGGSVTISGNNAVRIFNVNLTSKGTVTLQNLTLSHGNATIGAANGGAVLNGDSSGTLVVTNCGFLSNNAATDYSGGAIESLGPLTVSGCEFGNNAAGGGGAVSAERSATIDNCNFHDNSATNAATSNPSNWGGALKLGSASSVTLTNSTFTNNTAHFGGAVYIRGVQGAGGVLNASNNTFSKNTAGSGAAIYAQTGTSLSLTGCEFLSNSSNIDVGSEITDTCVDNAFNAVSPPASGKCNGGAVTSRGGLSVIGCVFDGNAADVAYTKPDPNTATYDTNAGGGLFVVAGTAAISNSQFTNNSADDGGGLYASASVSIDKSSFSGNSAKNRGVGGGITLAEPGQSTIADSFITGSKGGAGVAIIAQTVSITNSTISGNSGGRGIFASSSFGSSVSLLNVTVAANAAGIYYGKTENNNGNVFNLKNTLLASNNGSNFTPAATSTPSSLTSQGFNLSDDNSTSSYFTSAGDKSGPQYNAMLGPLGDHGGPTETQIPQAGSPAIDGGTSNGAPATDQRGVIRPQGAATDIGAVEVTASDLATPTPTPTPAATATPTPTPSATPTAAQLLNISTRMEVLAGDNVLIAGFIVTGGAGETKQIMIRGLGPSLAAANVPNPLADPLLELHDSSGAILVTNDNWQDASNASVIPNGFQPSDPRESVIVATLTVGSKGFSNYTAIVRGAHGEQGVGLVEAYDLSSSSGQFANISTRGFVDTGANVMIGGFILGGGTQSNNIIVRGLGPSLGIAGELADPFLKLYDGNGTLLAANDNWQDDPNASLVQSAGIPPTDPHESAMYRTLTPGNYTAIVTGVNDSTGIGLVEVYNLP